MDTVRDATYKLLRDLGMKTIFGNPGSNELPFLKNMPSDFKYILALHERSAAGIALGYAMAKGAPAFVSLHSIASVGNGLSAMIDAYYCHVPLIITAGQQDRRQVLSEPFLVSRAVEVAKPYVKWAYEPLRAEDVPGAIARGYYLAMQPPRGPVFISIPMDDWNHMCQPIVTRKVSDSVLPDFDMLDEASSLLASTGALAIVVGAQIEEDGAWDETVTLAEYLNADVYEEPLASRWTFPRTHHLFRGGLLAAQRPLADQLELYDKVLVIGAPVFLYYTYVPGCPVRLSTRLFQITNSPTDAATALAGTCVVGNIKAAVKYLQTHVHRVQTEKRILRTEKSDDSEFRRPNSKSQIQRFTSPVTNVSSSTELMSPAFVFTVLNRLLPKDAIISEECPSSKGDLDQNIQLDRPGSFYSVRTGILGFGLPAAIGLQLAHPSRRVVCLLGDGSAQYSIQALWTAVQIGTPVVFVILRNGDYSALRGFCDFTGVGRNVPGIEIPGINMVMLAKGYGVEAREVDLPEELGPALTEAFASTKPFVVSVNVARGGKKCMGMDVTMTVDPPNYG